MVHGRGDPLLCLSASLGIGPASGVSGNFSLLMPCRGSKAEEAELSCFGASWGAHLSYPYKCSPLARGLLLPTPILHLDFLELSADLPKNVWLELGWCW